MGPGCYRTCEDMLPTVNACECKKLRQTGDRTGARSHGSGGSPVEIRGHRMNFVDYRGRVAHGGSGCGTVKPTAGAS